MTLTRRTTARRTMKAIYDAAILTMMRLLREAALKLDVLN
jgi:hypothetical protein